MRRASNLRDLLFISLFFVLSTGLLQVPFVGMDPYGFYNLGNLAGTPLPIVLALTANLLVSLIASLMFDLLWRWQYSWRGAGKAWQRALWVVIPPMAFAYLWVPVDGQRRCLGKLFRVFDRHGRRPRDVGGPCVTRPSNSPGWIVTFSYSSVCR